MDVDLDIIIVSYNVKDLLNKCLDSVFKSTTKYSYLVHIVDNASSDGSIEIVKDKFPEAKIIANTLNLGTSRPRNQGIRQSQGQCILFLDPDTFVISDTIDKMMDIMVQTPQAAALDCKTRYPDGSLQAFGHRFPKPSFLCWYLTQQKIIKLYRRLFPAPAKLPVQETDWVQGACLMLRRRAIEECGFFDEQFFHYFEETELCYRFKQANWKVYVTSEAEAIHLWGKGGSQHYKNLTEEFYKSKFCYIKKQYSPLVVFFTPFFDIIDALVLLFYYPLKYLIKKNEEKTFVSELKRRWLIAKVCLKNIKLLYN